jgi:ADP-ribosylation factor-like protein 13B
VLPICGFEYFPVCGKSQVRKFVHRRPTKSSVQLIIGLDSAGKTTLVSALQHHPCEPHPTIGFSKPIFIQHKRQRLKLYDVGGGRGIRAIWGHYLPEVHGIIFVVDSANRQRMAEAAEEFSKLLQNACAQNKHILVLANKQDLPEALPADVVDAELPLHALPYSLYVPCIQHFA